MTDFKESTQQLVDVYLHATLEILNKDKFIIPMGMVLDTEGVPSFQALQPEHNGENIDMAQHLDAYREFLKMQRKGNRLSLLGYDVRIHKKDYSDAIVMEIIGVQKGETLKLVLPYKFSKFPKRLITGDLERTE